MNLKELVLKTGLSQSTVVRVLKGGTKVKPETKEKVFAAAKELGYELKKTSSTIGVVLPSKGNSYYKEVIDGINDSARRIAEYNFDILLREIEGYNVNRQLSALDEMSEYADVIIVAPINDKHIAEKINDLTDKGKKIITLIADTPDSKRICHIGVDYNKVGRISANLMGLIAPQNAKIGVICGTSTMLDHKLRVDGFISSISKYRKDIEIVGPRESFDRADKGFEVMSEMLRDNPELCAVYVSAGGVEGICKAVEDAGKKGSIKIMATGKNDITSQLIKDCSLVATIFQRPFELGRKSVLTAYDLMTGTQPESEIIYTECSVILKESL